MKATDLFPSRWFKADDLDTPITATIRIIIREMMDEEKQEQKGVIYFQEVQKGVVLKRMIYDELCEAFHEEDTDLWVGKKVQIYRGKTSYRGKVVPCVLVRAGGTASGAISPLLKKQLFDVAKETNTSNEAVAAFMLAEMQVKSSAELSEKQCTDLIECVKIGYVMQWWEEHKPREIVHISPDEGAA